MATAYRPVMADEQRRERRLIAQVTRASVIGEGGQPVPAELSEISIYGCRLLAPVGAVLDGEVLLSLDGGAPIRAEIVWNRAGVVACRFVAPISRAQLRALTIRVV